MAIGGSPPNAPREKDGTKGTAGRYGFVTEVARGYLGGLWLARDPSDATERGTVLVRHVVPIATASARAAVLDAARWAHATGAPTLEILENRNGVDIVTAFSDAEPLRALLRTAALKHSAVDPAVLLGIARALLEQLDSVHDAATGQKSPHGFGGVHPDSVLIGTDGRVELIDCGVGAAASAREPWRSDPQRIGYYAPEQIDPRGVPDARTDVFALGVLLWEAFANKRLFPAVDAKSARDRVQKGAIQRLDATRPTAAPGVSKEIADLVAKALERDPAARFQSVEEMEGAVKALGPASAAQIGAWAGALADVAIGKRRQMLERASVPGAAAPPLRASVAPKPRASVPPAAARPSSPPSPPAQAATADAPPPSVPPEKPPPSVPPARPSVAPPRPAAPLPVAGAAPKEASSDLAPSPSETPEPPAEGRPPERPRDEPGVLGPAASPVSEASSAPATTEPGATPESSIPTTQPSAAEPSAESAPVEPGAAASDAASTEAEPETDGDEMDVTDDELGAPPAPSSRSTSGSARPVPRSSLPPKLPPDAAPSLDILPDPSLLGAPTEPLASPMRTLSPLATLTGGAPERRRRRVVLAVVGAIALGVGLGGVVMRARRADKQRPLHEEAVAGSVVIVAQEPVPSASAAPSASAGGAPAASASAREAASAEPPPSPSAAPAASVEAAPTPAAAPTGTAPSSGAPSGPLHRPPASHGPVNSGYKPGGI